MLTGKENFNWAEVARTKTLKKFLARYFNLLTLIIVIIILLTAWFYLFAPKRKEIFDNQEKYLAEKIIEKENLNLIISQINKYKSDFKKISDSDKQKINNILISSGQEKENLFVMFESLIKGQGLTLKSISIKQSEEKKDKNQASSKKNLPAEVGLINIDLEITGINYNSLRSLLDKMEKSLTLIDVVSVNFSYEKNSVELKVVMYYWL